MLPLPKSCPLARLMRGGGRQPFPREAKPSPVLAVDARRLWQPYPTRAMPPERRAGHKGSTFSGKYQLGHVHFAAAMLGARSREPHSTPDRALDRMQPTHGVFCGAGAEWERHDRRQYAVQWRAVGYSKSAWQILIGSLASLTALMTAIASSGGSPVEVSRRYQTSPRCSLSRKSARRKSVRFVDRPFK